MTRVYRVLVRRRSLVALLMLLLYAAFMMWLFAVVGVVILTAHDPSAWSDALSAVLQPWHWNLNDRTLWLLCGIPTAVLLVTQFLFLVPLASVKPPRGGRARSLRLSMIMAGAIAALLTAGLGTAVYGGLQLWASNAQAGRDPAEANVSNEAVVITAFLTVVATSWLLWTMAFMAFARKRGGNGVVGRVIGMLLGGTIAEVIVVLPLDIMVRRRTDCYCAVGSFWTLVMSAWALMWLAGPGLIVAIKSKRRHPWWDTHCESCGYEKGPSPSARCPECGHGWSDRPE